MLAGVKVIPTVQLLTVPLLSGAGKVLLVQLSTGFANSVPVMAPPVLAKNPTAVIWKLPAVVLETVIVRVVLVVLTWTSPNCTRFGV